MHYYNLKVAAPRVCDKENVKELIKKVDEVINGKSKEKKLKQTDIFEMKTHKEKQKKNAKKDINKLDEKLKKHSKLHKGGMNSKHMKNMKKFIAEGDSFNVAHTKAVKLDKEKKTKY